MVYLILSRKELERRNWLDQGYHYVEPFYNWDTAILLYRYYL